MRRAGSAVVMGVSGSGKTVVGSALAVLLGVPFLEGDALHDEAAVAKMRAGRPLTDEDRRPWLDRVGAALAAEPGGTVGACSALKRSYRQRIAVAAGGPVRWVFLDVGGDELRRRLAARTGHFMPESLLPSQLATLEPPGADEDALVLDARATPDELAARAARWLEAGA